ncbi:MAG: delta-60 repeat domain-containing protein [Hyphomicrobiaceae bacterium]
MDTGFGGGDGIVTTPVGSSHDQGFSALQPDGRIVVAGRSFNGSNDDFAVVRYNADGTLDTSFGGGDGIVTTPIGSSHDQGFSVTMQPDGKIVVAGYSFNGSNNDFALIRYNADGTLDTGFGRRWHRHHADRQLDRFWPKRHRAAGRQDRRRGL